MSESTLKLTWGPQIRDRAELILHVLLLAAKHGEECYLPEKSSFDQKSNLHILEFDTTIENLLALIDKYSEKVKNNIYEDFKGLKTQENHLNKLLRRLNEIHIIDDKRKDNKQGSKQWIFSLNLPHDKAQIDKNLQHLHDQWTKKSPKKSQAIAAKPKLKTENNQSTNNSITRIKQDIAEHLCSLDCEIQRGKFQNKIDHNDHRGGAFLLQAERAIQFWFLSCLIESMGGFHKPIKLIPIQIRWNTINLYQEIADFLKIKVTIEDHTPLINKLTDLHINDAVVIIISRCEQLPENQLDELSTFWSNLFANISKISRTHVDKRNLPFYLFLLSSSETKNNKSNFELLKLNQIKPKEVEKWLTKNISIFQESKYNLEKAFDKVSSLPKKPYDLIDSICYNFFNLDAGIMDIQDYWNPNRWSQ